MWLEVASYEDKEENELTLTAGLDAAARRAALPQPLFTAAKQTSDDGTAYVGERYGYRFFATHSISENMYRNAYRKKSN